MALILVSVRHHECPLWVNFGLSRPTSATSGVGGKADENSAKPDIGQRMSGVGGIADLIFGRLHVCL